jgi:hypothetical protein
MLGLSTQPTAAKTAMLGAANGMKLPLRNIR